MLVIHTSNRLESLADSLAEVLRGGHLPPLVPETVITQSTGMSRWLSLSLAVRLGVTTNISFPFPAKFAEDELARILPGEKASAIFRREVLPWRIYAVLLAHLDEPDFALLRDYAGDDAEKLWQLCKQLGATFDRYIAHRPQMLREWDAGRFAPGEQWQAKLWQKLADGAPHPAALIRRCVMMKTVPAQRCAIFGLSSLAPTYLEFLSMVASHREVHLFLLAPTEHYWGDLQSEREKARFLAWCERNGKIAGAEHVEVGHPLLASLGKVGRDFHDALLDLTSREEPDLFVASGTDSLLARLQDDIRELRPHAEDRNVSPLDESIRLHNCHSPARELEVLHDQLLAMFEKDRTLTPRDVLVAVPDIEDYAPFIEGVFGAPESEAVRFPYCIADRESCSENTVADAFLRALELVDSRLPATAVLALLDSPAIHTKFGFSEPDLPLVRQWVVDSGVRWGRDAAHRAELGLPATVEHTWKFGLDRLILGFALPGDGVQLFADILPGGAVEGSLADLLGRFATFTQSLFENIAGLRAPRTVAKWAEALQSTLETLCESDHDFAEQWRDVAKSIVDLAGNAALAGHVAEVPFGVIRDCMRDSIAAAQRGSAFLRGGLTFCSLRPMRAIPHRVICLLGMNDGAFPRQDRAPAFDLTAANPRPGDRSTRDDDRYLFLESILSARDRLLISWVGQSAKDNSALPPSVVVSEFLDVLSHGYDVQPGRMITNHRLQPFSPRYFENGPLFSFSAENARGSASASARSAGKPFLSSVPALEVPHDVTLDRLTEALTRASRFFARERMGLELPYDEAQPEDVEPMEISRLDKYGLSTSLIASSIRGTPPETLLGAKHAGGLLPHGFAGTSHFVDMAIEAKSLAQLAAIHAPNPSPEPLPFQIKVGDWNLSGSLGIVTSAGLLSIRAAKRRGADFLRAWLSHLALCVAAPAEVPHRSILIRSAEVSSFEPLCVGDAVAELNALLDIYKQLHERPLPLFMRSGLAYAEYDANLSGAKKTEPLVAAMNQWAGARMAAVAPESGDSWNALVWRDVVEPLNEEFADLSRKVFLPMLRNWDVIGTKGASPE